MTRNQRNERCEAKRGLVGFHERWERVRVSWSARATVATFALCLAFASGCRSLFVSDEQAARFEPEQGRYIDGSDATRDWSSARETSRTFRRDSQVAQRDERSTTRGAAPRFSEEVTSDAFASRSGSPSWSQRLKNVFTPSFMEGADSNEVAVDDDLVRANPYNRALASSAAAQRDRSRVAESSSSVAQEEKKPGFWSKLFGGGNDEKVDAKEYPGAYAARADQPERVVEKAKPSQSKAPGTGLMGVFGKKRSSRVEPWNDPAAPISQFDKNDYMPPFAMIQGYYSLRDMTPSQYESRRYYGADRPTRDYYDRVEKTAMERRAYRSRSYAPSRYDDDLPVSPRGRLEDEGYDEEEYDEEDDGRTWRSGAASLSPIPQSPNRILQASSRSNSLGSTRPVQAVALTPKSDSSSHNALASYEYPSNDAASSVSNANDCAAVDPEALFGWSDETAVALASFQTPRGDARAVRPVNALTESGNDDNSFKDKLGKRERFEWFDQNPAANDLNAVEAPELTPPSTLNVALIPPALEEKTPEPDELLDAQAPVETPTGNESELSADSFPSLLPDLGALEPVVAPVETSNALQDDVPNQELSYEDDLDGIVDMAIKDPIYASSEREPNSGQETNQSAESGNASNSTLDALSALLAAPSPIAANAATASDLATAITESVDSDSGVAPSSLLASDPNEDLRQKASELNAATPAPDSLDARKSDSVAAPLTAEEIAWVEQVKSAIQSLLREREEHKRQGDDVRICDARLRLLFLVIGEYERSIQEIQDDSDPLKTFWEKECRGLETLLQNQLEEIDPTFVAERLRSGLDSFSGLCKLQIRKALLVAAPACYGLFEERAEPYRRQETVYAYAELDYVTSVETERGYEINVECRWRLLDKNGGEVMPFETQRCVNLSETKLRDVVLNVSVPLPSTISSGAYQLELDVVDLNAETPTSSVRRLPLIVSDTESNGEFY